MLSHNQLNSSVRIGVGQCEKAGDIPSEKGENASIPGGMRVGAAEAGTGCGTAG